MSIAATLMLLDRSPRRNVALPATVRRGSVPIDVEISDLSTTGFHATSATLLTVGSEISIGWASGGRHEAIVVRSDATGYGCEFKVGVSAAEVAIAAAVSNVVPIGVEAAAVPVRDVAPSPSVPQPSAGIWSGRTRIAVILGAAVTSWAVVALCGSAAYAVLT